MKLGKGEIWLTSIPEKCRCVTSPNTNNHGPLKKPSNQSSQRKSEVDIRSALCISTITGNGKNSNILIPFFVLLQNHFIGSVAIEID